MMDHPAAESTTTYRPPPEGVERSFGSIAKSGLSAKQRQRGVGLVRAALLRF